MVDAWMAMEEGPERDALTEKLEYERSLGAEGFQGAGADEIPPAPASGAISQEEWVSANCGTY